MVAAAAAADNSCRMAQHADSTLSSCMTRALMWPYAVSAAAAASPAASWKPTAGAPPERAAEPMLLVMTMRECRNETVRPCTVTPQPAALPVSGH